MRITIDTDEFAAKAAAPLAAATSDSAAVDAGAAPPVVAAPSAGDDDISNAGEPPAWLVANLTQATPGEAGSHSDFDDGGPAPA